MSITVPKEKLKNLDIGDFLKRGVDVYKNNAVTAILGYLVSMILSVITIGILAGPLLAGYIKVCTRFSKDEAQNIEKPVVGDIFEGFNVFLPALILCLLVGVPTYIVYFILLKLGTLGLLLGTLLIVTVYGLLSSVGLPLIAYEKTDSPVEALTISIDTVKASPSTLLPLLIVSGLIGYAGVFLLGFGVLLTMPFMFCVNALVFNELFRSGGGEEEVTVMETEVNS